MRRLILAVLLVSILSACNNSSGNGTIESADAAIGAACANLATNMSCPPAPAGKCLGTQCDMAAVPTGQPCSGNAMCTITVDPCPPLAINSPTSVYGCACLDGRWACDDCAPSGAECADAGED
ncbi:MAG TPA: hypothetical protein VIJ22_13980 [Polyangiaceae bacterium]